jgi:uncharacterized protein YggT (Ycf19 family)
MAGASERWNQMSVVDFILGLATLLLWLNWRSLRFDPIARRKPATLLGTLRPASAGERRQWLTLAAVPGLLIARALLYWQIGAPTDWVPRLDLGMVVCVFRADRFDYALLFSVVSFLRLAVIAYIWLVAVCIINQGPVEPDPMLKLIRLQVGRLSRAPLVVQIVVPLLVTMGLWALLHPLLSRTGVLEPLRSGPQLLKQSLLIAAGAVTTLKYLLPMLLLLHMASTYIYFGNSPLWEFVSNTAKRLLKPLPARLFRSARLDFTPLVGIVVILVALHTVPMLAIRLAAAQGVVIWPD